MAAYIISLFQCIPIQNVLEQNDNLLDMWRYSPRTYHSNKKEYLHYARLFVIYFTDMI